MKLASVPQSTQTFLLTGIGTVEKTIAPAQKGRIKFQATYWMAQLLDSYNQVSIYPGDRVQVVGRQGITLLVAPI